MSLLTLTLAVALTGCGDAADADAEPTPGDGGGPVTLDNCGYEVAVSEPPQQAVTMNQPATEVMLALGLADRLAGTAYLDDEILPEYADDYDSVPVLSDRYPSRETLLEAEPDFVYGSWASAFGDEAAGDRETLDELGVGSYLSPAGCPEEVRPEQLRIDDVFGEIRDVAALFGVPERAEELIAAQTARIDEAVAAAGDAVDRSVMWWDGGTDTPSVGGCCGAPGMIMSAVGVDNAFDDVTGAWGETSWETVIERDPDVIVLVDADWSPAAEKRQYLTDSTTLRELPAVVEDRMIVIPFSATAAGVRNVAAVEDLAEGLAGLAAAG